MTAALNELNRGTYIEPTSMTVEQWLHIWFDEYACNSIKLSTKGSYDLYINKHIVPAIGNIKLSSLRPEMIQKLYNEKSENGRLDGKGGLNPKYIKNIHNMLHEALEQAVTNGIISLNATKATVLPKQTKKEMRVLSADEQKGLLSVISTERHGLIITLALATGMRLGELLGLQWKDIDFNKRSLSISRTVNRLKNFDDTIESKTSLVTSDPKTKSSIRLIPINDNILHELTLLNKAQKSERLSIGANYENQDFIFATQVGKPLDPRYVQDVFKRLIKKADINDANFHCLRRTFATRALEANVPAKIVSEILGHSSVGITLDLYSHVSLDTKRDAIEKISSFLQ